MLYQGQDITNKPTHELVNMGICRTFQITSIIQNLSVFENVRIAKQARLVVEASDEELPGRLYTLRNFVKQGPELKTA